MSNCRERKGTFVHGSSDIGAAGMVGRKLAGAGWSRRANRRTRDYQRNPARRHGAWSPQDAPFPVRDPYLRFLQLPREAAKLVASRPDLIFHLAAVVSGEAEADFEKGTRINLDGTRYLFDAIRAIGDGYLSAPRLHILDCGFRGAFPERHQRRILPDAAHELRHSESHRRIVAFRLHERGFFRWGRYPAAHDLRPARQAEQSRIEYSFPASFANP